MNQAVERKEGKHFSVNFKHFSLLFEDTIQRIGSIERREGKGREWEFDIFVFLFFFQKISIPSPSFFFFLLFFFFAKREVDVGHYDGLRGMRG